MNLRLTIVWLLLLLGLASTALADDPAVCDVCGQTIVTNYYFFDDHAVGGRKNVCPDCEKLSTRCFFCGIPVRGDFTKLKDGRILCDRDNREAIHDEAEAKKVCEDALDEMNRRFVRYMTFPGTNVILSLVDRFHLESMFKSTTGFGHCVSIYGAAESNALAEDTNFVHSISILSDLRKSRLMAVCAHEYTHAWIYENVKKWRRTVLDQESQEGFCELIAYKLMEAHDETFEMKNIRENDYTKGQIALYLQAESRYGFNAILDWLRFGEDTRLDEDHLDRIMNMHEKTESRGFTSSAMLIVPTVAPPAPNKLVLKGISGTSQRRFAIINDHTFEPMERAKVSLGTSNVLIRCLEIRKISVIIHAEGSATNQELFLRTE